MSKSTGLEMWRTKLPKLQLVQDDIHVASSFIQEIQRLSYEDLCGGSVRDQNMAQVGRAGLLLAAGGLKEAHGIVQQLESPEAYYWHGIVHRREPDWSNAKYWFRQLGHHVVFDELTNLMKTDSIISAKESFPLMEWDPFIFVDLCEKCKNGDEPELAGELLILQQYEIEKILEYCFRRTVQ